MSDAGTNSLKVAIVQVNHKAVQLLSADVIFGKGFLHRVVPCITNKLPGPHQTTMSPLLTSAGILITNCVRGFEVKSSFMYLEYMSPKSDQQVVRGIMRNFLFTSDETTTFCPTSQSEKSLLTIIVAING